MAHDRHVAPDSLGRDLYRLVLAPIEGDEEHLVVLLVRLLNVPPLQLAA